MGTNNIGTMLDEEIQRTLETIKKVKSGSEEAKAELIKLDKLHGERIKELEMALKQSQITDASLAKIDETNLRKAELEQRVKQAEAEVELKRAEIAQKESELAEAKKGRRWRTFLDTLGIIGPLTASGYWMYKGLKFESEGQIYSSRTSQFLGGIMRLFRKG